MSEYWKSTPSYWCKFCSIYVRDTPLERKNHETSGKHQNNIQRSLRDLHKNQERAEREKQRAKDEVARLNGLVGSSVAAKGDGGDIRKARTIATAPPLLDAAAQRKAHAEQLAALGVALPEELKREVTGVGGWQTVSERVIDDEAANGKGRSLADIVKAEHGDGGDSQPGAEGANKGVRKRRAGAEDDDVRDEEAAPRRKAWGSTLKTYPGTHDTDGDDGDLEALLSGVGKKEKKQPQIEDTGRDEIENGQDVKEDPDSINGTVVKGEESEQSELKLADVPPPVMFKKRKVKK